MRFICEKKALQEGVSLVQKAINAQNTLQVLGNILLKTEGQKLYLSATNLEIAISTSIEVQVQNEGSITLPARLFSNYITLLKDGEVEIALENGESISIKSSDSQTKIKGLSAEEFPEIPVVNKDFSFTLSSEVLKEGIEQTVFSCSASSTRPVLSGVLFWIKENELRLVGTDSYRLGEKKITLPENIADEKYIVPARTFQELARILGKDEEVEVIISKTQVLFKTQNSEISSRLIEGNFPDYQRIIPKGEQATATISRSDFILAVKRAGIFAREIDNNNLRVSVEKSHISIATEETEIGSGTTNIEANVEGEGVLMALNAQYLLDALQVVSTENVVLKTGEALSPVKISAEDDDSFVHIIMPLKV
jgi:DNA polymerase-3 subunit beta